ncbi:MAG: hypothetical protein H0W08_11620 [Acidobacteria bacterium]|nr:hypothetical protein [Acidobacteriota bacterium]
MARPRGRLTWPTALTAVALLALASALVVVILGRRTPDAPEIRLEISTPATDHPASLAISPDGSTVAFVALDQGRPRLWLRTLDSASSRPLALE